MQAVWFSLGKQLTSVKIRKLKPHHRSQLVKPPTQIFYGGRHSSGHRIEPPSCLAAAVMALTTFGLIPRAHLAVVQYTHCSRNCTSFHGPFIVFRDG